MVMYVVQTWLWLLLFFVLGALLAALVVHLMFRPVDEVQDELDREAGGPTDPTDPTRTGVAR